MDDQIFFHALSLLVSIRETERREKPKEKYKIKIKFAHLVRATCKPKTVLLFYSSIFNN